MQAGRGQADRHVIHRAEKILRVTAGIVPGAARRDERVRDAAPAQPGGNALNMIEFAIDQTGQHRRLFVNLLIQKRVLQHDLLRK